MRYYIQERGQPWPLLIGDLSIPARLYYSLFVRPFFKHQQRRNPWHWRLWDSKTQDWLRHDTGFGDNVQRNVVWEFSSYVQAQDWQDILERKDEERGA